ncbi:helix-hairpin-helix domain-containing protein [Candidatus Bipolaricaulota bacterium]|nr:helix-hairpin-helix domain-containing protein [Candidatus Bipolaricaulota bacterium]
MGPVDVPAMVVPIVFEESGPLNVNRASAEELEKLPGIGPALAARIVAFREAHGPFRTVDDLLAVPGIGPKTLAGFRDLVTVDVDGD